MPRLTRDRITWLTYAQLGLWGFFLYGFGPVVPLLRDEQGTSAAVAGLHSTGIAVGALAGGALFAPVARRLGRGPAIWLGLAGVAAGVSALGLLRPLPATLAAVAFVATFGMMVVSGVSVVLTARHGPAAPAALTEANAACAGMGILAPLTIGATVDAGLGWRPLMAVEVGLITLVALAALTFRVRVPQRAPAAAAAGAPIPVAASTRVPAVPASGVAEAAVPASVVPASGVAEAAVPVSAVPASIVPASGAAEAAVPAQSVPASAVPASGVPVSSGSGAAGRLPRAYWIAWVLMSVTGSIEVCLSLWTADVLRTHAGLSAGGASAAVAAIVCGMFAGRIAGGRAALRWAPVPLLLGALTVSMAGFALFWGSTVGWLAVAGLVVLGLGNALHYPLAISIALAVAGPAADKAAGWSAYSMGVGFGIAPVALGWVADGVGPHPAFLLLPAFIAVAVLLTVRLGRALPAPVRAA
ncbi:MULTISPECIES: MFS transporter [unclassified Micromonospora]|uniref:MFS transporter n=1 Tax=unclassified Micromonospora TaxID=2617518 RepID=UPI001C2353A1|nr:MULTISPECIES: MFS transporter [unclassified Micromonospora]MBU8858858.1 MFS transporter [Micromonospora sp. WMMB482]MDM4778357.1 MFS transporter [Micromonospora sp. b486]